VAKDQKLERDLKMTSGGIMKRICHHRIFIGGGRKRESGSGRGRKQRGREGKEGRVFA